MPARWSESDVLHAFTNAPQDRQPTAHVEMGPFYKRRAPATAMLRAAGDPGVPLTVTGRAISVHGDAVAGATIEVWQADHGGLYDLEGYHYRAALAASASGASTLIGRSGPLSCARCAACALFRDRAGLQAALDAALFATDEVFEGKPEKLYTKDPLITSVSLVRPVRLAGPPDKATASVEFELVLRRHEDLLWAQRLPRVRPRGFARSLVRRRRRRPD